MKIMKAASKTWWTAAYQLMNPLWDTPDLLKSSIGGDCMTVSKGEFVQGPTGFDAEELEYALQAEAYRHITPTCVKFADSVGGIFTGDSFGSPQLRRAQYNARMNGENFSPSMYIMKDMAQPIVQAAYATLSAAAVVEGVVTSNPVLVYWGTDNFVASLTGQPTILNQAVTGGMQYLGFSPSVAHDIGTLADLALPLVSFNGFSRLSGEASRMASTETKLASNLGELSSMTRASVPSYSYVGETSAGLGALEAPSMYRTRFQNATSNLSTVRSLSGELTSMVSVPRSTLNVVAGEGNSLGAVIEGDLSAARFEFPEWFVGPHGSMPNPRPLGFQSHHGVNTVWLRANYEGFSADAAPAILMRNDPFHNATRGVFPQVLKDVASQQGVSIRNVDWTRVSPGTAWRLAEEQFEAAQVPQSARDEYYRQLNRYIDSLPK